jgi:shikimate dehydrogenase
MLVAQAKYAAELFLDKKIDDKIIEKIIRDLQKESLNVVLVGMPGCGKSTVGKNVAKLIGKEFIDTDALIVERENKSIPQIFEENGEEYFRKVESEVLKDVGKLSCKVISTGGGVIKNRENYFALKQNSVIIWLDRAIDLLVCDGRPLSKDKQTVKKLFEERKENYAFFADEKISNDGEIDLAVKGVVEVYENFSY